MTSPSIRHYFTGLSEVYDKHRPSYPTAAIDFVVRGLPEPATAADVGCGTGISTRLLAAKIDRVLGIDPNADMLDQARSVNSEQAHRIEYRLGTGENTGLPDKSVNLVLCAQSFHWFDPGAAMREFHRILKPDGRLALMWNIRNDRNAFTAGYGEIVHRAQADAVQRGLAIRNDHVADITIGGHFTVIDKRRFPNPQTLDLEGLLGRARSASYFPRTWPLRDELEAALRSLFQTHQQNNQVIMQQFAEVTLGRPA